MQLVTEQREVIRGGVVAESEFKFKMDGIAFRLMADNLYTDKILAVIREYSCNAIDAMKSAGKGDRPITVHLPNAFEPWFSVRDEGTGLSPHDCMNLYSTYFDSTKRNENVSTGCFGLGSKSAFAYTDTFTVTTRWNGLLYTFSCVIAENGVPTIAQLGEPCATDDCNGVEITVPVRDSDFYTFAKTAVRALRRFEPLPTVTGNKDYKIDPIAYWIEGDDGTWKMHKETGYYGRGTVHVIQGHVTYPLDSNAMGCLDNAQRSMLEMPLDIWFDNGSLSVQTSREGLSYDERTIAAIKAKLNEIAPQIPPKFQDKISHCKTLWEARIAFTEIFNSHTVSDALKRLLSDPLVGLRFGSDNASLSGDFVLNMEENDLAGIEVIKFVKGENGNRGRAVTGEYDRKLKFSASRTITFWYDDLGHGSHSRLINALEHGIQTQYDDGDSDTVSATKYNYLIKTSDVKILKKISALLGKAPIKPISLLPKRDITKNTSDGNQKYAKVLKWNGTNKSGWDSRENWTPTDLDLNTGGFFVVIHRYKVMDGSRQVEDLRDIVRHLVNCGVLPSMDTTIYGIRQGMVKDLPQNANVDWVNLFDYARAQVKVHMDSLGVAQTLCDMEYVREWRYGYTLKNGHEYFANEYFEESSQFGRFIKAYNFMAKQTIDRSTASRAEQLKTAANKLSVFIEQNATKPTFKLKEMWEKVVEHYAMLAMIDSYNIRRDRAEHIAKYIRMIDGTAETEMARFVCVYSETFLSGDGEGE